MYILGRVYHSGGGQVLFHCSIVARQSYQSDFCYCSLTPPSALLLPPCASRMAGQYRTKSAVPWPAGQAWDAILADSTNRVMLAMPLAVSSSVSRPSQLLHTSCYTAGSGSMTVSGSMAVWWTARSLTVLLFTARCPGGTQ